MSQFDPRKARRSIRSDLRMMLGDGFSFGLMVGVGESYVAPFALALGFGVVASGLVATIPMLAGAFLQLVTPAAVARLGSHKRWVVLCATLQALSFVPLITGAAGGSMSPATLYTAVALYWAFGMAAGPAWNTWAGTLVPSSIRAGYFARRSAWSQVALFAGLALGALILRRLDGGSPRLEDFAWVFGVALFARLVSARFLARQSEELPVAIGDSRISPAAMFEHLRSDRHGRLLGYFVVFQLSVWIAAPFFTAYMLGPIGLDYIDFAILTGSAFLARVVAMPWLGRVAHRSGTRRVLLYCSLGIVPLPLLWLLSDAFLWLLVLQLFSGMVWGGFELATLLSFFERIPTSSRTSVLTAFNLMNAAAISGGAVLGSFLLGNLEGSSIAFPVVFVCSSFARLGSLWFMRGMHDVVPESDQPLVLRTLSLRPSAGAIQRPVLAGLPESTGSVTHRGAERGDRIGDHVREEVA